MLNPLSVVSRWLSFGILAGAFLAGMWTMHIWEKATPVPMTAHAQVNLGGGNVLAARTDAPKPPATVVPQGAVVQSTAHIQVAARKPVEVAAAGQPEPADCVKYVAGLTCPAIDLDTTLVKNKDGQLDMVVKGEGVDQATFSPVQAFSAPAHPWALGATYDTGRRYGVFVDRDAGPLRLGLEVGQAPASGLEARLRVGWRF